MPLEYPGGNGPQMAGNTECRDPKRVKINEGRCGRLQLLVAGSLH